MEANELASKNTKANRDEVTDTKPINCDMSDGRKECLIFSGDCKGGFFADQFENLANFRAHYEGTGPEIWEQSAGKLDAFVAAAGTGGTVSGVSRFLKVRFFLLLNSVLPFVILLQYELLATCVTGKELKYQMFSH